MASPSTCRLGYPCMVRPSYVLGGRAMEIVYSDADLKRYIQNAVEARDEVYSRQWSCICEV